MIVIKHQYFSARDRQSRAPGKAPRVAAVERALAHVRYIQHRPGEDRGERGRDFFSDLEDRLDGKVIRKEIRDQLDNRVVAHKLTLAPEIDPEDKKAFTREVMHRLSSEKGLDLRWYAVEHNNTDHHHVHVVILGKDANGKDVRFDKRDYNKIKEFGDRYLERHHPYELELSRRKRERNERERAEQRQKDRELARDQRIRDGLELPKLHKMIFREQQEPYVEWKKKHDDRERSIDVEGNKDKHEDAQQKRDKDSLEWRGEKYSKDDSYERLAALYKQLRADKKERLPKDDYDLLRGWIENRDRERFSGVVDKQLSQAKQQDDRRVKAEASPPRWVDPIQQQVMANPVVGAFMTGAALANTVVSWIDLRDNRDRLKEAGDALEAAKRDKHQDYLKREKPENRKRDEEVIDKIDRALSDNEEAHKKRDEDRKRSRDRGRHDPFTFDPWGRY